MATKLEIIYDVRERLNAYSDDVDITNEYISYLIDKVRSDILTKKYSTVKRKISQVNKQRIELNIIPISHLNYRGGIVKSNEVVPTLIFDNGNDNITTITSGVLDTFPLNMVSSQQFSYVGLDNPFIRNMYYGAILDDDSLYLKSWNKDLELTELIRLWGVFESPYNAWLLSTNYDSNLDYESDIEYPFEADLIPALVDTIIDKLLIKYKIPEDRLNDGTEIRSAESQN